MSRFNDWDPTTVTVTHPENKPKRCERCGASLVAPEEMNAHARGVCEGLEVPPPPDLFARIRHARRMELQRILLARSANRRGSSKSARATNDMQVNTTMLLAERFDEFRRQHTEFATDKDARTAFRRSLPEDMRSLLPADDGALARRIRRGREYRRKS